MIMNVDNNRARVGDNGEQDILAPSSDQLQQLAGRLVIQGQRQLQKTGGADLKYCMATLKNW